MENSKLINKSKSNTRTIGINTDMQLINTKCFKCMQENNFGNFPFTPYFLPFHYPICNCMLFALFQNNFSQLLNSCKCENHQLNNFCNSEYCLNKASLSSNCKNCGNKTNSNNELNHIQESTSKENFEFLNENKSNIPCGLSTQMDLKEQILSDTCSTSTLEGNNNKEEIAISNTSKVTNAFLEETYSKNNITESTQFYGPTCRNKFVNEEQFKNNYENKTNDEKQLLNHLLQPNMNKITLNLPTLPEDSDVSTDSENEDIVSEDDNSKKTVVHSSNINKTEVLHNIDTRVMQRNNETNPNFSKRLSPNKNSDMEMLMMIKALVNNQYDGNSTRLNKLLNQMGNEELPKQEHSKSNRSSLRKISKT